MLRFLRGLPKRKFSEAAIDHYSRSLDKEAYTQIDCLQCANCCRTMTPTYRPSDIKRIASNFEMTTREFKDTFLKQNEDDKDWVNNNTGSPCHFLDLKNNFCTIYEIRPIDCAGFPHTQRRDFLLHNKAHKQNILYCPITYHVVQGMMSKFPIKKS